MTELLQAADDETPALAALRRDLHEHPELGLEEVRTSDIVACEFTRLGFRMHRGLAKTGIVATLSNGGSRRLIGLRADMDALPIHEEIELLHASRGLGSCMPAAMMAIRPCCSEPPS